MPPKNPYHKNPLHPNYLRRAIHHDYKRPAKYLITLSKNTTTPSLSYVTGDPYITDRSHPGYPDVTLTDAGKSIEQVIGSWPEKYPQIEITDYIIMPDHVHLCLKTNKYIKSGLSRLMANFMGTVSRTYHNTSNSNVSDVIPFFARGFNDRIAYDTEQWEYMIRYVKDNPRRLLIKRQHPDLYFKNWIITFEDGLQLMARGNIFLLHNPCIQNVRFSRRYTSEQFESHREEWLKCIDNEGVIVSPFIHPNEREIRDIALDRGGSIIRICENGFQERFMPHGIEFDYMGTNRLLLVAPMEHNTRKENMTYRRAQQLNWIAAKIADNKNTKRRIRPA